MPRRHTLTPEEHAALDKMESKLQHIRAAVRGVVREWHPALFIHGEGGTSKSYTVMDELAQLKAHYTYHNTRLTGRGLVDVLEAAPAALHLIEDAETLLDDKRSWGVLRSACWSQSRDKPMVRPVTWTSFKTAIRFNFTGGLIVISNADLSDSIPEIRAIKGRIGYLRVDYEPAEILALGKRICLDGFKYGEHSLSAEECLAVYHHILSRLDTLKRPLDLRLLINGFRDYLQHKTGDSPLHWTALLDGRMQEQVFAFRGRRAQKADEAKLAQEIYALSLSRAEKIAMWKEKTGLGEASFYNALKRATG
jgi:hypothetical protein